MKDSKKNILKFIKISLRIVISAVLSLILINMYEFSSLKKIFLFFLIFIVVSLILEPIFKQFEK